MSQPYSAARARRASLVRKVIGENVREIRLHQGFTQAQFSKLLVGGPAHESYFRGIEAGLKEISLVRLVEIADTMGVPVARLLEGL